MKIITKFGFFAFTYLSVTFVRHRFDEEYHSNSVVPAVKHKESCIILWKHMATRSVGEIAICQGRMNGKKSLNVLDDSINAHFWGH